MSTLRILMLSPLPQLDPRLGACRVYLEMAKSYRQAGAEVTLFSVEDSHISMKEYGRLAAEYLSKNQQDYDVVEVPDQLVHAPLPIGVIDGLSVVRSVLLSFHETIIQIPVRPLNLKSRVKHWLTQFGRKPESGKSSTKFQALHEFYRQFDFINVANSMDRELLGKLGYNQKNITVQAYGLDEEQAKALRKRKMPDKHSPPTIAFLGSFDYRKGCLDMHQAFAEMKRNIPDIQFRLIGTRGLMQTEREVRQSFPRSVRSALTIIPQFEPEHLPRLLEEVSVGIFPSYWEGFGLAVIEMLAAGIPVVAYDVPGPCDILPADWLLSPGDVPGLINQTCTLLSHENPVELSERALSIADRYRWDEIGRATLACYANRLQQK